MNIDSYQRFEIDINNYKKGKKLGSGGFGAVYEVQDIRNKRIYAAKILDYNESDENNKKMIDREISILMFANNPTIIDFYGYSYQDFDNLDNVTILMEFAKQGSLDSLIEKVRNKEVPDNYTNTERQIIIAGIARGMKYLHDCNIIHRDLKPGNVLLDENFHPKMTDFGLSKFFESGKSKQQTIFGGTPMYMAPEILDGEPFGRKVDVYAFGILMYEVLTDSIPYPDLINKKIKRCQFMRLVVDNNYRPKFDPKKPIKKSMRNLIERCWSASPADRPTFNEIFYRLTKYSDKEDCCFLDDVDINQFNKYIKSITQISTPIDNLICKIEKIEKDRALLKAKNNELIQENKKMKIKINELMNKINELQNKSKSSSNSEYNEDRKSYKSSCSEYDDSRDKKSYKTDRPYSEYDDSRDKKSYKSDRPYSEYDGSRDKKSYKTDRPYSEYDDSRDKKSYKTDRPYSEYDDSRDKKSYKYDRPYSEYDGSRDKKSYKTDRPYSEYDGSRDKKSYKSDRKRTEYEDKKEEKSITMARPIISRLSSFAEPEIDDSKPILGIDLGTSFSAIGTAKNEQVHLFANNGCIASNPSVVCIINDNIYFGEEAIKKSSRSPKNFIYDTKRMLGKKFNDPLIQEYRKNWTFDIAESKTGGILIRVEDKYYEPYQISGMILVELVKLANSQLECKTNQAIITIPTYFTEEQIYDTRRAAKYANIELIELLKEPLAATYCYSYINFDKKSSNKKKDILIYDFGGGTLDVTYVEVKGKAFNILATAGDSDLGGQDFTNSIFELITPQLDELCKPDWKKNSRFVNSIKIQCEKAKINLTAQNEFEFYFDIQSNIAKHDECTFEYRITRDDFESISKPLFDRCMKPVYEVLENADRDPHQIDHLILVGGSSYLPKIVNKFYELTGKNAYHGVSAHDAVAYGACLRGLKHLVE